MEKVIQVFQVFMFHSSVMVDFLTKVYHTVCDHCLVQLVKRAPAVPPLPVLKFGENVLALAHSSFEATIVLQELG